VVRDAPTISRAGVIQGERVGGVTPYKPVRGSNHREKQGEVMKTYRVTATGTWDIEVEAESQEDAERLAYIECLKNNIDVELMNLEFEAFNEEEEL
jgi:hypothetical protein